MIRAEAIALAHGGAFVCSLVNSSGTEKKIFVRGVVPGEIATLKIVAEYKNYAEGELVEIIEKSSQRVVPPCKYFSLCGGCDLQHIAGAHQRELKLEMVRSALLKQGGLEPRQGFELLGSDLPYYNYRARVTLHLGLTGELGFFALGSRDLVAIDECLLADPLINQTLSALRPYAQQLAPMAHLVGLEREENSCFVVIYLREEKKFKEFAELPLFSELKAAFTALRIFERKRAVFSQPAMALGFGHFSQVNLEANRILVGAVVEAVSANSVTELFAGAGNFSLPLARAGRQVTAVEVESELVERGRALAEKEQLARRITFVRASAESYFRKHRAEGEVLLLDPPRSGAKHVIDKLAAQSYKQIVYVSCSLPTLTRDLKALRALGYSLEKVQVLDMFPQTHHVETVSVLRGGGS